LHRDGCGLDRNAAWSRARTRTQLLALREGFCWIASRNHDVCRYAPGAAQELFGGWSDVDVLPGGGLGWTAWNYLLAKVRHPFLAPIVDRFDRAVPTSIAVVLRVRHEIATK